MIGSGLTCQESDDGGEDRDNTVDDGHYYAGNGVDDCHDTVADGLETRDDGTHID